MSAINRLNYYMKAAAKPKVAPKTKTKLPPVIKSLHPFLKSLGFSQKHEQKDSVTRYVKRGFYDGDFPNAHQSLKTTHNYTFEANDENWNHFKAVDKLLHGLGLVPKRNNIKLPNGRTKKYSTYSKGSHFIMVEQLEPTKGSKQRLRVMHTFETSKPDLDFEKSGKGRGQII